MVYIISRKSKPRHPEDGKYRPTASNKTCWFPKKSHHGYWDDACQKKFYSKKEKLDYMNKHGLVEGDSVSREHLKRVDDFIHYQKEMKVRDPENKTKWKQENYPD